MDQLSTKALTRTDFLSGVDPRWCAGCGDFSVFHSVTKVFASLGIPREKFAVISGIGCSSRFPYYTNTYGFHTLHGRAPTVAMGLKMTQPDLNVWITTGDGDALSIGGNHFIHLIRRNPNIKLVLFNNQIYGLTKGQASPTSSLGAKTKSTPYGTVDRPLSPLTLALGAGATFVARAPDNDPQLVSSVVSAAAEHQGTAIVEVLINCVIFNDGVFDSVTNKATRDETTVRLEQGKPLLFGKSRDKGIRLNSQGVPEVVSLSAVSQESLLVHDMASANGGYAFMLSEMGGGSYPVPYGVLKAVQESVYHLEPQKPTSEGFEKVLRGPNSWRLDARGNRV